jgi:hypothetical protein
MGSCTTPGALSGRALLRWQFQLAHDLLDATMDRLTPAAVHRQPPGTAAPVGACYAQVVLWEDLSVNAVLAAATPLALSTWAGRTGLSDLPPLAGPTACRAWARRVRVNLAELRAYAQAVYAATDAYLADLRDEALDLGRGEQPACLLSALLLTLSVRRGEIACFLALEQQSTARRAAISPLRDPR